MSFSALGQGWPPGSSKYEALPQHAGKDGSLPAPPSSSTRQKLHSLCSTLKTNLTGFRLFSTLFQLTILAMACFGLSQFVEEKLGRIIRVHRLSPQELSQVGWTRPTLAQQQQTAQAQAQSPADTDDGSPVVVMQDFNADDQTTRSIDDQNLLVLTPCRNCAETLPRYFDLLTNLTHPKSKTSVGFLVGEEVDNTIELMSDFMASHQSDYRRLTLLKKDFSLPSMEGPARHSAYLQDQRRQIMAKARTFLLTSTLEPSVDWVLWLDADVIDIPTTLFQDLLTYGNAGLVENKPSGLSGIDALDADLTTNESEPVYDIITPNIFQRFPSGYLKGFDMNNWAETAASLRMKAHLPQDQVLVEGNILHPTGRSHLADAYTSSNYSSHPDFLPSELPQNHTGIDRFDPESTAYVGKRMPLDAVGGVATLVRATAHRVGAVFPAFVIDHQVETEGFGVLARALGARICGLPNYGVLHRLPLDS